MVYDNYKDQVDFYFIYIKEAHPIDSARPNKRIKIEQPKTFERRLEVAAQCCKELELTLPVLVDDMEDSAAKAYGAMPDRLFILGADGKIAYRGDRGPRGFKVDEMEQQLSGILLGAGSIMK
jgi:hypothetical protein